MVSAAVAGTSFRPPRSYTTLWDATLQNPEADALLPGMTPEQRMASWHLVGDDGRVYSGGDAFPPLLRLIPGGGPVARVLAAFPWLGRVGYRAVAARRSLLGRVISARRSARARERIEAAAERPASRD
jgi:predicted DCC family thiol-disulfide oxidoreductase YuxK